jgi:chaperonin GroES
MASRIKKIINSDFKPTAGHILVEPIEAKKQTDSGIYLPDSSEEKPIKGKVIAVGPDEITDSGIKKKSPAKVGDYIIYKKWGGSEVNIAGKEYLFAKFEDILAIVKK